MGLERRLQHNANFPRLYLIAPRYLGRLPRAAKTIDLAAFNRQPRLCATLVSFNHFQRQIKRFFEKLGYIGQTRTGSDRRDLQRSLRSKPIVDGSNAALPIELTSSIVRTGNTEPTDFAGVELRCVVTHDILQDQRRRPGGNGKPIRLHAVVHMIRGNDAAGAGHVFDDPGRVSGYVLADMTGDESGVLIISPTERVTDNESECLVAQEILRPRLGRQVEHNHRSGHCSEPMYSSNDHDYLLN